jgi:hypothetical protein
MNIPDHFSENLEAIFWVKILKFFDAVPGSGIFMTLDPGSGMEKNPHPESGINIRDVDPKHWKKDLKSQLFVQKYTPATGGNFFLSRHTAKENVTKTSLTIS